MRKVNEAQDLRNAIDVLADFLKDKEPSDEVAKAYYYVSDVAQESLWTKKRVQQIHFERNAYAAALGIGGGNVLGAIVAYLFTIEFSLIGASLGCLCLLVLVAPEIATRVRAWREERQEKQASLAVEEPEA